LALVQRHEERAGIGERDIALAAQNIADGVAATRARQIGQFHALRLEEALVGFGQDVGDLADGLAPAREADLALGRGGAGHARERQAGKAAQQAAAREKRRLKSGVHGVNRNQAWSGKKAWARSSRRSSSRQPW